MAEKLNQAFLPIIDFETCSKPAYWWDTLRPSMICAGYESPDELKSACQVRKELKTKKKQLGMLLTGGTLFLSYISILTLTLSNWVVLYVTPKCYCL